MPWKSDAASAFFNQTCEVVSKLDQNNSILSDENKSTPCIMNQHEMPTTSDISISSKQASKGVNISDQTMLLAREVLDSTEAQLHVKSKPRPQKYGDDQQESTTSHDAVACSKSTSGAVRVKVREKRMPLTVPNNNQYAVGLNVYDNTDEICTSDQAERSPNDSLSNLSCKSCNKNCNDMSIQCSSCFEHFHPACEMLTPHQATIHQLDPDNPFCCSSCTHLLSERKNYITPANNGLLLLSEIASDLSSSSGDANSDDQTSIEVLSSSSHTRNRDYDIMKEQPITKNNRKAKQQLTTKRTNTRQRSKEKSNEKHEEASEIFSEQDDRDKILKQQERKLGQRERDLNKREREIEDKIRQMAHVQSYSLQLEERIKELERNERIMKTRSLVSTQNTQPGKESYTNNQEMTILMQRINAIEMDAIKQRLEKLEKSNQFNTHSFATGNVNQDRSVNHDMESYRTHTNERRYIYCGADDPYFTERYNHISNAYHCQSKCTMPQSLQKTHTNHYNDGSTYHAFPEEKIFRSCCNSQCQSSAGTYANYVKTHTNYSTPYNYDTEKSQYYQIDTKCQERCCALDRSKYQVGAHSLNNRTHTNSGNNQHRPEYTTGMEKIHDYDVDTGCYHRLYNSNVKPNQQRKQDETKNPPIVFDYQHGAIDERYIMQHLIPEMIDVEKYSPARMSNGNLRHKPGRTTHSCNAEVHHHKRKNRRRIQNKQTRQLEQNMSNGNRSPGLANDIKMPSPQRRIDDSLAKSIKHLDRRYGPYRPGMRFVDYKHNSPSTTSQAALYQHRQVSKVSRDDNIHVNHRDVHTTSQVQQQTESNPDQARHNTNESSNSGSIPQYFLEMDHQLHTEK